MLLEILENLPLETLLHKVAPLSNHYKDLIMHNSQLWSVFEFSYQINIRCQTLDRLLYKYAEAFEVFEFGYSNVTESTQAEIDSAMMRLEQAEHMKVLNLACAEMSTLAFVRSMADLRDLTISECRNLFDNDLECLYTCTNLRNLDISFLQISGRAVATLLLHVPSLIRLNAGGVLLKMDELENVLTRGWRLRYLCAKTDMSQQEVTQLRQRFSRTIMDLKVQNGVDLL